MKTMSILMLSLMLMACSSTEVAEIAIEALGDVDISYNALQCPAVKNNCGVNGHYEEWIQENGKLACACNK